MNGVQVDDAAPTLFLHGRPGVLGQQERRGQHQGNHEIPTIFREVLYRSYVLDTRYVDEDICLSILLQRKVHQRAAAFSLAQISWEAVSSDSLGSLAEQSLVDVSHDDMSAFLYKHLRRCESDTAGSACYNGNFVLKHNSPPFLSPHMPDTERYDVMNKSFYALLKSKTHANLKTRQKIIDFSTGLNLAVLIY